VAAARFWILRHRPEADTATSGLISWRLLATNNRDLGRASVAYPNLVACRDAVLWLQEHVTGLRVVVVRSGPTSWSWRLLAGDRIVAVASRGYQRRIQADQAAAVTLALIPGAELVGLD
jgi:hypothetical protein